MTAASRGFGHPWAKAALERGDKVASTARNMAALAPRAEQFGDAVLSILLDVTDWRAVFDAVAKAHQHFGRLKPRVGPFGGRSKQAAARPPTTRR
ncbi:SDR family NAD(P)-dependent oxidoreductase [Pararhizobium sp. PWRC1-1]|uniref:SDR family NAD(P)-dependent oxidoreductase n=1 Tax=Pararhizobium sp. PWRC1-1 TaxID=2804566 RepID=UPI003CE89D9C